MSTLTHTLRTLAPQPTAAAAEMEARKHETAATLVNVATNAQVHAPFQRVLNPAAATTPGSVPASTLNVAPSSQHPIPSSPISTSIGFGIDPRFCMHRKDATEAAIKAVRDAMERGVLFPTAAANENNLQVRVRLGVPSSMSVSPSFLNNLLPPLPLLPLEMVVGGLLIPPPAQDQDAKAVCTVVACITFEKQHEAHHPGAAAAEGMGSPTSVASSSPPSPPLNPAAAMPPSAAPVQVAKAQGHHRMVTDPVDVAMAHTTRMVTDHSDHSLEETARRGSKSIEMLAHISAQIHEQEPRNGHQAPNKATAPNQPAKAGSNLYYRRLPRAKKQQLEASHDTRKKAIREAVLPLPPKQGSAPLTGNYAYKKLPPGVTPKMNKRLFVKHSYRDHSNETAAADEYYLTGPTTHELTANATFPVKLHETLSLIEMDGYSDIIGWLPHGRSFKIHKQKEFVETILPKYFVMTKKSSFLRQLNLYCFNRLSGFGPNQGSYYHEKFLRGMKFLARRMTRQKVNGNGIRAAGNPDEEPDLSQFCVCPPGQTGQGQDQHAHVEDEDEEEEQEQDDEESQEDMSIVRSRSESLDNGTDPILRRTVGGIQVSFPLKLQRILDKLESEGETDIISWQPHGRAFLVHDPNRLMEELLPVYFNQSRYSSFQRQLHMYNCLRITSGRDKGAYWHPNLQRGQPELALTMQRTRVNGKGTRRPGNPQDEPDLYAMEARPIIPAGTPIDIPTDVQAGNAHDDNASASSEQTA